MMTEKDIDARARQQLAAALDRALRDVTYTTSTGIRQPDPDDRDLTIEKLYESILQIRTGLRWRVMKDGIPTRDPETGDLSYYKIAPLPALGIPEMWCASTEAAEALIKAINE